MSDDGWFGTAMDTAHIAQAGLEMIEGVAAVPAHFLAHETHLAPYLGAAGLGIGGMTALEGAHEIHEGHESQGWLDVVAGGLGIGSSAASLAELPLPGLSMAAGVAGAASWGNEYAEEEGLFGEYVDENGEHIANCTYADVMGDFIADGGAMGREVIGGDAGETVGEVGGGALGGLISLGGMLTGAGERAWSAMPWAE